MRIDGEGWCNELLFRVPETRCEHETLVLAPSFASAVSVGRLVAPRTPLYSPTMGRPQTITLRRTQSEDVPLLYAIGIDEASNLLAGTKPRTWDEFQTRWTAILSDHDGSATRVIPRVILADGVFVGSINIFPQDGLDSLGYWISREHWGRGIASEAVALLLDECSLRPLYATTAGHNQPSMRVLEKNGFTITARRMTPASARNMARETVTLVLR